MLTFECILSVNRGRPETEAPLCRYIADKANVVVVAPDYWKAPREYPDLGYAPREIDSSQGTHTHTRLSKPTEYCRG